LSSVDSQKWALLLVGLADYIEGATRIQKYGFLGAKNIKGLTSRGFYDDWKPSKYGPYSPTLARDIDALVSAGLIKKFKVKNNYDYWVDRFALSDEGRTRFNVLNQDEKLVTSEIKEKIIDQYNNKSLMDVLHDVYSQFPEYAVNSTIRSQVGRKIYESDSYLNPQYDESLID
jgi:uncharacterized protein YwgA